MGTGTGSSQYSNRRRWNYDQIAAAWILRGGPLTLEGLPGRSIPYVMAHIAIDSESGGDPGAISPTGCEGLFQICPPDDQTLDPIHNIDKAILKAKDDLGHWTRWGAENAAIVDSWRRNPRKYDSRVANLQQRMASSNITVGSLSNALPWPFGPLGPADDLFRLFEDGGGALKDALPDTGALGGVGDVAAAIGVIASTISTLAQKIGDPEFWKSAGKVALGLWLLMMGLRRIFYIAT